jgi:hypothetical protein
MKLSLTTRYKKQDTVLSRCFLVLLNFLCILFSTFLYLMSFFKIFYLEILPIFLLSYIMYTMVMSILIPISLLVKNFYIGSAVSFIPILLLVELCVTGNDNSDWSSYNRFKGDLFYSLNNLPIAIKAFSLTTIFLIVSIYLSLQIFT